MLQYPSSERDREEIPPNFFVLYMSSRKRGEDNIDDKENSKKKKKSRKVSFNDQLQFSAGPENAVVDERRLSDVNESITSSLASTSSTTVQATQQINSVPATSDAVRKPTWQLPPKLVELEQMLHVLDTILCARKRVSSFFEFQSSVEASIKRYERWLLSMH
jgi:hypothetical protein